MTSIKLKFRPHRDGGREGALYFQIIHDRTVKQVRTDFHIFLTSSLKIEQFYNKLINNYL